jgi:hypothetical protein
MDIFLKAFTVVSAEGIQTAYEQLEQLNAVI